MNSENRRTLEDVFDGPVRSDVRWTEIESLFRALGAHISEGRGSRVRVSLNGADAVFHRPHPQPVTDKGAVKAARRLLDSAGVSHEYADA